MRVWITMRMFVGVVSIVNARARRDGSGGALDGDGLQRRRASRRGRERRRRTHAATFATTLDAIFGERRGRNHMAYLNVVRRFQDRRQEIIGKESGLQLTGFVVVIMLHQ